MLDKCKKSALKRNYQTAGAKQPLPFLLLLNDIHTIHKKFEKPLDKHRMIL